MTLCSVGDSRPIETSTQRPDSSSTNQHWPRQIELLLCTDQKRPIGMHTNVPKSDTHSWSFQRHSVRTEVQTLLASPTPNDRTLHSADRARADNSVVTRVGFVRRGCMESQDTTSPQGEDVTVGSVLVQQLKGVCKRT